LERVTGAATPSRGAVLTTEELVWSPYELDERIRPETRRPHMQIAIQLTPAEPGWVVDIGDASSSVVLSWALVRFMQDRERANDVVPVIYSIFGPTILDADADNWHLRFDEAGYEDLLRNGGDTTDGEGE